MPLRPRVLIVDDNAANRTAFAAVLEKDFDLVVAESGEEAVRICRDQAFAVIVLDVRMPGMDGFDTAEALRKRDETHATPILFTSAYDQTLAQMTRGYVAGATDFLFSPVEADLLKLKVSTYAQIHLRHEALRLKVLQLSESLEALHEDLVRRGIASTRLRLRIRDLENTASELRRQTSTVAE